MIPDKIIALLSEKGFKSIRVNVNNIYLYYDVKENNANVVMVYNCPQGTELTEGQYRNIQRQVYQNFVNQNYSNIKILNIICTQQVETSKKLYINDDNQWTIDTVNSKLILYENQGSEFLNLRKEIEYILEKETENKQEYSFNGSAGDLNHPYNGSPGDSNYQNNNADDYEFRYNGSVDPECHYKDTVNPKYPLKKVRRKYFSTCNTIIILINVIIFFIVDFSGGTEDTNRLLKIGALYWPAVEYYHQYYRVISYMFLHSGLQHLGNNMLVLFVIGDNLERATGKWKYLMIYFASGIIAGISSMGYNTLRQINVVSVGASGAIFGVVGAMAYIVAVNKGHLENISTRQIAIFVFFSLYGGLTSQGVDNAAHIGGLIGGALIAAILYRKPKIKY